MTDRDKEKAAEEEEHGFRVIDRRREGRDESTEPAAEKAEEKPPPAQAAPEAKAKPTPEPEKKTETTAGAGPEQAGVPPNLFEGDEGFAQFVLSLATSAYMHLGLVPGPDGKPMEKNLPLAKQTIDILGMLETKTTGNRTEQESKLFDQILNELRMRYVEEKKKIS